MTSKKATTGLLDRDEASVCPLVDICLLTTRDEVEMMRENILFQKRIEKCVFQ